MAMSLAYLPSSLRSRSSTSSLRHHRLRLGRSAAVVDRMLPVLEDYLVSSGIASGSLPSGFGLVRARSVAVGSVCWRLVREVRCGVEIAIAGGLGVRPWREFKDRGTAMLCLAIASPSTGRTTGMLCLGKLFCVFSIRSWRWRGCGVCLSQETKLHVMFDISAWPARARSRRVITLRQFSYAPHELG